MGLQQAGAQVLLHAGARAALRLVLVIPRHGCAGRPPPPRYFRPPRQRPGCPRATSPVEGTGNRSNNFRRARGRSVGGRATRPRRPRAAEVGSRHVSRRGAASVARREVGPTAARLGSAAGRGGGRGFAAGGGRRGAPGEFGGALRATRRGLVRCPFLCPPRRDAPRLWSDRPGPLLGRRWGREGPGDPQLELKFRHTRTSV